MELQVIPHKSIGPLSLGQTQEEVQEALKGLYVSLTSQTPEFVRENAESQQPSALDAVPSETVRELMERYGLQVPSNPAVLPVSRPIHRIEMIEERYSDTLSFRYTCGLFWFQAAYRDNRAAEISVDRLVREQMPVMLCGFDLFKTPADELIPALKEKSPCVCGTKDEELGYEYQFDALGLRFWREDTFHPKLLKDENYVREMAAVLEDQKRFRYFDTVTIY